LLDPLAAQEKGASEMPQAHGHCQKPHRSNKRVSSIVADFSAAADFIPAE